MSECQTKAVVPLLFFQGETMNQESSQNVSTMPAASSVLVVDDDEGSQELLAEMLGSMGFKELYTAENGRLALKVLSDLQRPPKFLICDIYMPAMDGFEFMDQLGVIQSDVEYSRPIQPSQELQNDRAIAE